MQEEGEKKKKRTRDYYDWRLDGTDECAGDLLRHLLAGDMTLNQPEAEKMLKLLLSLLQTRCVQKKKKQRAWEKASEEPILLREEEGEGELQT